MMADINIAVVAEFDGSRLAAGSREAAALGRILSRLFSVPLCGVALADDAGAAREWAETDGLRVILGRGPGLDAYDQRSFLSALTQVLDRVGPALIVVPHTAQGADFAPRLAARLGLPYIPSVCGVEESAVNPTLVRQVLGGKVIERVELPVEPAVVTVSPGAFAAEGGADAGWVEEMAVNPEPPAARGRERIAANLPDAGLGRAEVIVAAGRGAGAEGIGLARELAGCFRRGVLAASRPLVDAGLLPYELQVGQTGRTVAPRVYIACGVSGALQHVAGMSASNFIVAINTDPNAPIFRVAHLGAVMDLKQLLPALIEQLKEQR